MNQRRADVAAISPEVPQPPTKAQTASTRNGRRPPVSDKKVQANRENALKSTGPKTERGKYFSRTNALRHGLFSRFPADFALLGENPKEYETLLQELHDDYHPVGRAEELEVESMAKCWWRLRRAYRFENSSNRLSRQISDHSLSEAEESATKLMRRDEAVIGALERALEDIERTGEIPHKLKQDFFAMGPGYKELFEQYERSAQELLNYEPPGRIQLEFDRRRFIAVRTVLSCMAYRSYFSEFVVSDVRETILAQHVVPHPEVLERLLRYKTAIERSLDRSQQRLERLQNRRKERFQIDLGQVRATHD